MSLHSPVVNARFREYIFNHSVREHPVLQKIREENREHPEAFMQINPEQAQLLTMLLKLMNARNVIELGVFLGYSGIALAEGLAPGGQLLAAELNPEYALRAQRYWEEAGVAEKIKLFNGPALGLLNQLLADGRQGQFDFIFIDADKDNYIEYYNKSVELVRSGGMIAVDNVLWYGRIFDETDESALTRVIRELNTLISNDMRVEVNIIPIGDGLTLAMKK